jgi:hypothetical protein
MSRQICINLTQAEARAWVAGAMCLIRPLAIDALRSRVNRDGLVVTSPMRREKWQAGDVLIGREAWCYAVDDDGRVDEARPMYAIDEPDAVACDGDGFTLFNADGSERSPFLSPTTMPAALARHRMRVVSVRVCRWQDVTKHERRQTRMKDFGYLRAGADTYVSVTMLERT